jgi:hypothetical protein
MDGRFEFRLPYIYRPNLGRFGLLFAMNLHIQILDNFSHVPKLNELTVFLGN